MKRRNINIRQQSLAVKRKCREKVQIGSFTFDKKISREKLACAIILHEYPLSIIDHVGFREFATSLQPLFKMVSRNTIKGDIMKIYEVEKDKMISYLEKLQSRVAITTDMWTSNQKKGYMAITVHYIDESWLLHHHIVRLVMLFFFNFQSVFLFDPLMILFVLMIFFILNLGLFMCLLHTQKKFFQMY